ncbi:YciI family protein [uncultured Tateyamaria sp.]|uniref:YciI family protein n=1 Tax=uncultured Tateyamaria sp. TaxID=455651 RepID=UPI002617E547|nr:YciI family protein [uncultured Tateyamaria sp.]
MRYTFLLYTDPADLANMTEAEGMAQRQAYQSYIEALNAAGVFVDTDWLQPVTTATTLTLKGGTRQVQDGPFADTKERLGGYFVIEVPDLDVAMSWAEKCPAAQTGKVEIRPSAMPTG